MILIALFLVVGAAISWMLYKEFTFDPTPTRRVLYVLTGRERLDQEWKHEQVVYIVPNPSRVLGSFVRSDNQLEVGGITESDTMERQTRVALQWVVTQPDWEFVVCSSSDHMFDPDALQQWLQGRSSKNLMACEYRDGMPYTDAMVMSRDTVHRVLMDETDHVLDAKPVPIRTHSWIVEEIDGQGLKTVGF